MCSIGKYEAVQHELEFQDCFDWWEDSEVEAKIVCGSKFNLNFQRIYSESFPS